MPAAGTCPLAMPACLAAAQHTPLHPLPCPSPCNSSLPRSANIRWVQAGAPAFNKILQVAGGWAFGWGLAGVFLAAMQGRLRLLNAFLTARLLVPIAALSYRCDGGGRCWRC